jgi:spore germination protein YaaH
MKRIAGVLLLFFVFFYLNAEEPSGFKGIHQIESENYAPFHERAPLLSKPANIDISPLAERDPGGPDLSHVVFGYLPYWKRSSAPQHLQLELLSHLAIFDFNVDTNGNISTPPGWPNDWINTMNSAHENGVKLILCVTLFNRDNIKALIRSTSASQNFYEQLADVIAEYDLDGVNIDFEGPYVEDRGTAMNNFMQGLTNYIKTHVGAEQEISFAGPAVNWSGWDLPGLADACDYIFIMGYNYWYSGSTTTGPCAPIEGATYNLVHSLVSTDRGYGGCDPDKLILGLPYYGLRWKVSYANRATEGASVLSSGSSVIYYSAKVLYNTYGRQWSERYSDPWTFYQSSGDWYQVWCDDGQSLDPKEKLVFDHDLLGTGMWALCYDEGYQELWDVLRNNFYRLPDTLMMDNFEDGPGRFYRAPAYSGSTQGISSASYIDTTSETSYEGDHALKIHLMDDTGSSADWKVRLLSGSGSPRNNIRLGREREIRFALKTDQAGAEIAVLIDDPADGMEMSLRKAVIADDQWHEYAFDLRPAAAWHNYSGGNGSIDGDFVTLDGLLFLSPDQAEDRVFFLDALQSIALYDTLRYTIGVYVKEGDQGIEDVAVMGELTNSNGFAEKTFNYGESLVLMPQKTGMAFSPEQIVVPLVNKDTSYYFETAPVHVISMPEKYVLYSNYPNPFNPQTTLTYHIPEQAAIRLNVYDIRGKYMCTLADQWHSAGDYKVNWYAGEHAGGIYIAVLYVNEKLQGTQKMILLK